MRLLRDLVAAATSPVGAHPGFTRSRGVQSELPYPDILVPPPPPVYFLEQLLRGAETLVHDNMKTRGTFC